MYEIKLIQDLIFPFFTPYPCPLLGLIFFPPPYPSVPIFFQDRPPPLKGENLENREMKPLEIGKRLRRARPHKASTSGLRHTLINSPLSGQKFY